MKYQTIKEGAKYSTRTTHQGNASYTGQKCHRNKVRGKGIHGSLSHSLTFQHNATMAFGDISDM